METALDIKQKQAAYHDWEAQSYDGKWNISFDERCVAYADGRMSKVLPTKTQFDRVLEVGTGTGFFLINLWQAGYVGSQAHATDISEGMLATCKRNGAELGLDIETRQGDAEALPYDDDSFDLVIGHAFLHHLPEPETALAEMFRILAPGGTLVVAGEPTRWGDRIASVVKRSTYEAARAATAVPGMRRFRRLPAKALHGDAAEIAALEAEVDLHTFPPSTVEQMARTVGFADVEVVTEELVSNWFGWTARTLEATVSDGTLGPGWAMFCYRSYLALSAIDDRVMTRVVPRELFYNLILRATKPALER